MLHLAPSILTADFGHLADEIAKIERGGADMIHVDIMDGQFVPNMSMGPATVAALRRATGLTLDVHLMTETPETMIPAFIKAGADIVTVHYEACPQLHHTVSMIHELGAKAGVALCPGTPVSALDAILGDLDLVLIMTVNPGFGGQKFIASSPRKVAQMRKMLDDRGLSAEIEVDGGVNAGTVASVAEAGATVMVMGSCVYDGADPEGNARRFRGMLDELGGRA